MTDKTDKLQTGTEPAPSAPAEKKARKPRATAAGTGKKPAGKTPKAAGGPATPVEESPKSADMPATAKEPENGVKSPMRILAVGAEVMPFAATGGLGDVMGSLPAALKAAYGDGADIRVVMPLYDAIKPEYRAQMKTEAVFTVRLAWRRQYCGVLSLVREGVTYYFIDNEYYFKRGKLYGQYDDGERYAYFCRAVIDMMREIDFYPDVLFANDWQSAMSVVYLRVLYAGIPAYDAVRTVFTIHNIEYQGKFSFDILEDIFDIPSRYADLMGYDGTVNLMKAAIECADRVTTVSPSYAKEIMTPDYSHRLHYTLERNRGKLSGILNGIDLNFYNPETDPDVAVRYGVSTAKDKVQNKLAMQAECGMNRNPDAPMMAMVTRLAAHKGVDMVTHCLRHILESCPDLQFVLLGTGEPEYEAFFRGLENDFPDRVHAFLTYNRALSKRVYAAADLFLMPSVSEPCGLSQMIACRYGALPIVRKTGGLGDSIHDGRNGFVFDDCDAVKLEDCVCRAIDVYRQPEVFETLRDRAMRSDFSWDASAQQYMQLFSGLKK